MFSVNKGLDAFKKDFINKYSDKYDLSLVEYKTNKTPVIIICPVHGEFKCRPDHLLRPKRKHACPECSTLSKKWTKEELILTLPREDDIDFSKAEYQGLDVIEEFICKIHGKSFRKSWRTLKKYGPLCECCRIKPLNILLKELKSVHGDKYDYSLIHLDYIGAHSKVRIICSYHNEFIQSVSSHLSGTGCPGCSEGTGWSKTDFVKYSNLKTQGKVHLYVIKCFNKDEEFYKVGLTGRSINKRFKSKKYMPYKYEVLYDFLLDAASAWTLEKNILKTFAQYQYIPKIFFGGYTECFYIQSLEKLQLMLIEKGLK